MKKSKWSVKHIIIFGIPIVTINILLLCILYMILRFAFIPSLKNAYSIEWEFYHNKIEFNQISGFMKDEGRAYLSGVEDDDNYWALLRNFLTIDNQDSEIVLVVGDVENNRIEKDLTEKLTDSVKETIRRESISGVELEFLRDLEENGKEIYYKGYYFTIKNKQPLLIRFEFKDIDNAYLVYYEGTPDGQLVFATEMVWESMKLDDNWYVCYELDQKNKY